MNNKVFIIAIMFPIFMGCKSRAAKTDNNGNDYGEQRLEGQWELNYIKYQEQKLQELYSRRIPFVSFDLSQNIISGNNGCNSFSGKINISGNKISFKSPMTATKMYCEGQGELVFMQNLTKAQLFSISKDGKVLQFTENGIVLMRFIKN